MEGISKETLKRLPSYLIFLKDLRNAGVSAVSSTLIAERFKFSPVQVRKDLAAVSSDGGKPKTGFIVDALIRDITAYLGYNDASDAILVGAGQLGRTLMSYGGFKSYGLEIVAAFDNDYSIENAVVNGKRVFGISRMTDLVKRMKILIGIITVPKDAAQGVADLMISAGVRAIWNFAPVQLEVPDNILVRNENLAASLAILSKELSEKIDSENK